MTITLTQIDPVASPLSSVITGRGIDEQGRMVVFGGDWRPMRDLAEVLEYEGEIQVEVEPWQVLSISDPED